TSLAERFLCDTTTSEPIVIWVLRTISKLYISASVTDPRTKLTLHIAYIRNADRDSMDSLLKHTQPRPCNEYFGHVTVAITHDSQLFSSIYNATTKFINKANMTKILPTELAVGDIILVESVCHQWRTLHMRTSSTWTQWHSGFLMDSLSLLARGLWSSHPKIVDTFTGSLSPEGSGHCRSSVLTHL
ncbi:hypothetical protein GY45DRAFT_1264203, partial [Cubamyces sp. BRFM 1775]